MTGNWSNSLGTCFRAEGNMEEAARLYQKAIRPFQSQGTAFRPGHELCKAWPTSCVAGSPIRNGPTH